MSTSEATAPLPHVRACPANSLSVTTDTTLRHSQSSYWLLTAGGWLMFGIAMMIGSLDVMPWHVILASESVYVVVGFLLALLLGRVYDLLGVRPGSFARTLAISVVGSCLAGM